MPYTVGPFVLPFAFLVLGIGAFLSEVVPAWAKWVPVAPLAAAVITYGFHQPVGEGDYRSVFIVA